MSNLIGRMVSKDGIKSLVNKVGKSKLAQSMSTAVVDGASKALQPKSTSEKLTSAVIDSILKRRYNNRKNGDNCKTKTESENSGSTTSHSVKLPTLSYIDKVINSGKGIVYD